MLFNLFRVLSVEHNGRIMPQAGLSADASISTLSVERVRQPVPSRAENVPHHQPAFSDRCTISGFFFSIRSAEPPQDHARGPPSMEYWNSHFHSGAPMPRYLTQHTLACLTRQGAEVLAQRMQAGGTARAERVLVNMLEGKMFVEFRADSREALEGWLKTEAMHFDWLVRIEWEMQGHKLQPAN
jgi:hypothetical protein